MDVKYIDEFAVMRILEEKRAKHGFGKRKKEICAEIRLLRGMLDSQTIQNRRSAARMTKEKMHKLNDELKTIV